MKKLVSLGLLSKLPQGKPRLMRAEGQRLACFRRGDRVDVLADRCPHEGHPLSMGMLRDGVVTCPWHNWKFDLGTGRCLFGGESVRRYPTETIHEEVFVDLSLDPDETKLRLEEDFVRAVNDGSIDGALREGLRLARLANDPLAPWVPLLRMASVRSAFGAADGVTAMSAALSLETTGILDPAEALAVAAQAVADETRGRPSRPLPDPIASTLADRDGFLEDLLDERRTDAVARVLGLPLDVPVEQVVEAWLLPFAALKVWDRGTTMARVLAGVELARTLGERGREELLVGLATSLGWAVAESDLPAWRTTRLALREAAKLTTGEAPLDADDARALAVARSERETTSAVLAAAHRGASPTALLDALVPSALARLASYDLARSRAVTSSVTAWDAARAVVLAYAALALAERVSARFTLSHAVMLASLVGRLSRVALAEVPPRVSPDLRTAARTAALAPRCAWASRGRAATLASACVALARRRPELEPLAIAGLVRATDEDTGGGLERIATTARRLVETGEELDETT